MSGSLLPPNQAGLLAQWRSYNVLVAAASWGPRLSTAVFGYPNFRTVTIALEVVF